MTTTVRYSVQILIPGDNWYTLYDSVGTLRAAKKIVAEECDCWAPGRGPQLRVVKRTTTVTEKVVTE